MSYKHLSQNERYQIYALMKAGHNQLQVAQILGALPFRVETDLRGMV